MGTAIDPSEIKRFEVTEVYSDPHATVDIILVHGLNGHPHETWTSKKSKKEVFWPSDLLPATLKSVKARILVYGYNADVYSFGGNASSDMIHQHAQTLLANLSAERKLEERSEVPIIWVAHSLGGILVKRALTLSCDLTGKGADDKRSIFVCTYGIIFLGTPHTGADAAKWGHILQSIGDALIPRKIMDSEPQLIQTLKSNNETLQNINLHFLDICNNFEMNMVHEAVKTDLRGTKAFIVDKDSASPLLPNVSYYGIEATHSGMCKFESKNSPGYTNVSGTLKSWIMDSPSLIRSRVAFEREARRRKNQDMARELLGGIPAAHPRAPETVQSAPSMARLDSGEAFSPNESLSSSMVLHSVVSIEPELDILAPFIIPPGFRPNSLFIGRETQLHELHKTLFDTKRRSQGTSACVLHSLPGGGKTALAREYLYSHIDDFPGGIFWVNAKSVQQLELGFWDIYRRAVINHEDARFSPTSTVEDLSKNPHEFIDIVTDWLRLKHEWLLVLDGVHFHDEDTIRRFLPDSVNTSLIYTSTERSVSGDHHFINPKVISVPPLSAVEAQQLFLQELDRNNPSKDDLKHTMELVQLMGFNPLVIHTVAQRLKRTRETLAKFTRSYASEPILRGLDTYKAVIEELKQSGAMEALNLMSILCFLSQHIPVELISLGLKSLDVDVKATEPDTGTSLNNTFMVLNSFALIERNEPHDSVSSSQSSQSSRLVLADNIDMLRIHSVVQDFFVDSLRASGELQYWLAQAIKLFCASYQHAIEMRGAQGLVADYRQFNIHGDKLLEHVNRSKRFDTQIKSQLLTTLEGIREEIEGRTPSSSQKLAQRAEAFQISIFDRTSSSSDTGPDTPGQSEKNSKRGFTWGEESRRDEFQSPISITHETSPVTTPTELSAHAFPPLPTEDTGYDPDDDYAMSEGDTVRQGDVGSKDGSWHTVGPRRGRRQKPTKLLLHRTIKAMDKGRYSDTVGAWRSLASDPRVRNIAAHGTFRSQSRGRSSAEDALSTISAKSPPPARGGGVFISARKSSFTRPQGTEARPIPSSMPTYAAAVAGFSPRPAKSRSQVTRGISPVTNSRRRSSDSRPIRPPISAALTSLQRIPTLKTARQIKSDDTDRRPQNPPPRLTYQLPYPSSQTSLVGAGSDLEQHSLPNPSGFGRNTSPLPYERIGPSSRKRNIPHGYQSSHSQQYAETTSSSPGPSYSHHRSSNENSPPFHAPSYVDRYTQYEGGYTSQPMSRDASGQSGGTLLRDRRHSLAETEPSPQIPGFSPPSAYLQPRRRSNLSRTSYTDQRAELRKPSDSRKSPRMGFTGSEDVDWAPAAGAEARTSYASRVPSHMPARSRPVSGTASPLFNPAAPSFQPRSNNSSSAQLFSPNNELAFSNVGSQFPGSSQLYARSEEGFPSEAAPEMGRTGSGGIMVGRGRYVVGFGEYPAEAEEEFYNDVDRPRERSCSNPERREYGIRRL